MKEQPDREIDPKRLLITIDEAASRLTIGRSHIYAQMQKGALRSVKIGRSRRILELDLQAFIEELLSDAPGGGPRRARLAHRPVKTTFPSRPGRR